MGRENKHMEKFWGKDEKLQRLLQWLCDLTQDFLVNISLATNITWNAKLDANIWVWSDDTPIDGGFLLSNAQIYVLLQQKSTKWIHLNNKWQSEENEAH